MLKKKINLDKTLIIYVSIFAIISLISIYSASMYLSKALGNLVLKQAMWYAVGIIFIFIIYKLKISFFIKISPYIYLFNVILLLGLLFVGPVINGSRCWYIIEGIGSFQPSEFMKISLVLIEAYIIDKFSSKEKSAKNEFKLISLIFIVFLIPSILTFLEPDTGAVIIYFIITLLMLFISGIRLRWFIIGISMLIIIVASFLAFFFLKQDMFIKIFGSDFFYRIDRVINWQNGSGMQLENSLAAIGSSGILGHGFNKTPLYFPEAGTDFIFSVYASNFGLIGSCIFILLVMLFDIHLIKVGMSSKSIYKYIISGILGIFIYQQIQNISMTLGLLPITGITLPFISYGGSSLLSYMILSGFVISIYNEKELDKNNI